MTGQSTDLSVENSFPIRSQILNFNIFRLAGPTTTDSMVMHELQ